MPAPSGIRIMNKVTVIKSADYSEAIDRLFGDLDLTEQVFRGKSVFIKPNWVAASSDNLITSPKLIVVLVEKLLNLGAREVIVGENPTIGLSSATLYETLGVEGPITRAGGRMVELDKADYVICEPCTDYFRYPLALPRPVLESDFFIDVPVAKTHGQGVLSLGIKNLIGLLDDETKGNYHREDLHAKAAAILSYAAPHLTVIDGMVAGEGQGPAMCRKLPWETIIGGLNVVATDAVAALAMGVEPREVPAVRLAAAQGFGPIDVEDIEVKGDGIGAVSRPFLRTIINPAGRYDAPAVCVGCCEGCLAWMQVRFDPWQRDGVFTSLAKTVQPVLVSGRKVTADMLPQSDKQMLIMAFGDCVPEEILRLPGAVHIPGCPPSSGIKPIQDEIIKKHLK